MVQDAILSAWYIRDGRLHGVVCGHPTLSDGMTIATSEIVEIDFAAKKIYTQNTCYALGEIHPRYYDYAGRPAELMVMEGLLGLRKSSGWH